MSAREIIFSTVEQVAREQSMKLNPPAANLALAESGLNSLCWAIIFARLENEFGFDPLADGNYLPITLGDVVQLFERPVQDRYVA